MAEDLGRPAAGRETGPAPAARETRPTPSRSHRLLSVIVPVYNERNTVAEILRRMRSVDLPVDLEVVVVDDGSTDGTDKVLAALEDSTVRLVRHAANRGKAAAVRTGLEHARGQLVLIQDADLEYDPEDWPRLLDPVLKGKARVVYGSRFRGERMTMPLQRWVSNRALAMATSLIYMLAGFGKPSARQPDQLQITIRDAVVNSGIAYPLARASAAYVLPFLNAALPRDSQAYFVLEGTR